MKAPNKKTTALIQQLKQEDELRDLARHLILGEPPQFMMLSANASAQAEAAVQAVLEMTNTDRDSPLKALWFRPRLDRAPDVDLTWEDLLAQIWKPMVKLLDAPPLNRLWIIDASSAVYTEDDAWFALFQRMNELRNTLMTKTRGPILLVLTPVLWSEFANRAADFYSVASGRARVYEQSLEASAFRTSAIKINRTLRAALFELAMSPEQRAGFTYIESMVDIVREVNLLKSDALERVELHQIRDGSGYQVEFCFHGLDHLVPVDVMFLVELPEWLREKVLEAYKALEASLMDGQVIPMGHGRIFSELAMTQKTGRYPGIKKSEPHHLINYCLQQVKNQAFKINQLKRHNDTQKLSQMDNILKFPTRANFRIIYLLKELDSGTNTSLEKLTKGYFRGSTDAIRHYLETNRKGINHATTRVESLMSKISGFEIQDTVIGDWPGNIIEGEV